MADHQFKVGDKVVFTNDFGVCWGIRIITELVWFPVTRDDDGPKKPRYHFVPTDCPWYPTGEENLKLADAWDLQASAEELQAKYGFIPTIEQLGGCY